MRLYENVSLTYNVTDRVCAGMLDRDEMTRRRTKDFDDHITHF